MNFFSDIKGLRGRCNGLVFPFVIIARMMQYAYCLAFRKKTFTYNGSTLRYYYHPLTFRTERCVEIPIIMSKIHGGKILEVGNVLQRYADFTHDIVDKYEISPGVINEDVVSYQSPEKYNLIVSISTIEHVGRDENPMEEQKAIRAITHMKSLLTKNGEMILTVPLAYNRTLDEAIYRGKAGLTEVHYMKRTAEGWEQVDSSEISELEYNKPYPCANAIAVCTYICGHTSQLKPCYYR